MTLRQRLGLSLSKLTQDQIDAVIQRLALDAAKGDTRAITAMTRLMGQAFGAPQPEPEEQEEATEWEHMSPAQRRALQARILQEIGEIETLPEPPARDD